ncbi:hypothetical protein H5410_018521 [Solanum commersonii]|uniref:Uncharacterized protein n=1 Tax=Solanum commersonii TaxID=4109 RepID=A0A9J6A2D4_SOLCO|nr:hypothetical protein H5410_018521 [Solanum commersonii]
MAVDASFLLEFLRIYAVKEGMVLTRAISYSMMSHLVDVPLFYWSEVNKVELLDKVIEDVNKFYNGRWRVKIGKYMKHYVSESWQFLIFLVAIMLITLQAFCSVYSCARVFRIQNSSQ